MVSSLTRFQTTTVDATAATSSSDPPNKILLFTILNPLYPITPDIMHTICSPYGSVERIVMIRKNGVQVKEETINNKG